MLLAEPPEVLSQWSLSHVGLQVTQMPVLTCCPREGAEPQLRVCAGGWKQLQFEYAHESIFISASVCSRTCTHAQMSHTSVWGIPDKDMYVQHTEPSPAGHRNISKTLVPVLSSGISTSPPTQTALHLTLGPELLSFHTNRIFKTHLTKLESFTTCKCHLHTRAQNCDSTSQSNTHHRHHISVMCCNSHLHILW